LRVFEEPRDFGCAGLIITVIILIVFSTIRQCSGNDNQPEKKVQPENVVEKVFDLKNEYSPTMSVERQSTRMESPPRQFSEKSNRNDNALVTAERPTSGLAQRRGKCRFER
jgi:hypothetical protein